MAKSSTAPPLSEQRTPGESEKDLMVLRTLDSRAEALVHGGGGADLSPAAAADLVRHDLALFKQIMSNGVGDRAAEVIGEIAEAVPLYRAELARRDPSLLAAVEAANAIEQANISAKEDRKASDMSEPSYEVMTDIALEQAVQASRQQEKAQGEVDGFKQIESVPDAFMRSNAQNGFVEVKEDGITVALPTLAAINDWVENHDASVADKERLVSLGIKAHKAFNEPHQSESENTMEAAAQTPKAEVRRIGANMPKPDWQLAIELLKAYAPQDRAAIYIPKAGAEYGGQVLLLTDTHIVQRVGKSTAIAHDLDALQNGRELAGQMDGGQIKRGTHMKFQYGDERGNGTAIPFNQKRADEIKAEMTEWAQKAITNAKGRDTFLKHLENATKHIAQPPARERAHEPQRAPARAPQRDR